MTNYVLKNLRQIMNEEEKKIEDLSNLDLDKLQENVANIMLILSALTHKLNEKTKENEKIKQKKLILNKDRLLLENINEIRSLEERILTYKNTFDKINNMLWAKFHIQEVAIN